MSISVVGAKAASAALGVVPSFEPQAKVLSANMIKTRRMEISLQPNGLMIWGRIVV